MSDPRLNSSHLLPFRREQFREARDTVLDARGMQTGCLDWLRGVAERGDWPSLSPIQPEDLLPEVKHLLVHEESGQIYPLQPGLNTLGRFADNDIVFTDDVISRRHCVILVHASGACELHDTASLNGTYVNGRRVERGVSLSSGDRIQLCRLMFAFLDESDYRRMSKTSERPGEAGDPSRTAVF